MFHIGMIKFVIDGVVQSTFHRLAILPFAAKVFGRKQDFARIPAAFVLVHMEIESLLLVHWPTHANENQ